VGTEVVLEQLKSAIDERIDSFLRARRDELPETAGLIDEIERVITAGGKRLRPAFCYWGYRSTGAAHGEEILALACAFELLHTFAVVHDDIMDSATERRGQPTTVAQLGTARALLVGDLALVLSDAAFWASGFPVERLGTAFSEFTTMREQVIAGQHMDLESHDIEVSEQRAREIAVLKSGSYSIEHPLLIGALVGGGDEHQRAALRRFGRPLGEAFQLRDDLLGVFGDPETMGKAADSDIREGKRNVLFAKTMALLPPEERSLFEAKWGAGAELDTEDIEGLRKLIDSSGARAATEDLLQELAERARLALGEAVLSTDARFALEALMEESIIRTR
jgi:geranylgeranyl diphosphate synthase, type I